jgi:tetratricopeptide (TPR) repeat protein
LYYDHKRYADAIGSYNRAIALKPNHASAFAGRGNAYWQLRRNRLAISDYSAAIRLNPKLSRVLKNRARLYWRIGDRRRALADITRAIAVGSREPAKQKAKYHHTRAGMYKLLNRRSEAIRDFRAALRLDPARSNSRAELRRLGATP